MSNQLKEEAGISGENVFLPSKDASSEIIDKRATSKTAATARPKTSTSKKKAATPEAKRPRGGSPWAARHAAKHAAEAKARAEAPPTPGSARATVRVPTGADAIKAKIAGLHNAGEQIRTLRKDFAKNFFDIGKVLLEIQEAKLYEAKGYGSFEAFLERELDLGKLTALQLGRVATVFQQEAAVAYGFDRCVAALAVLDVSADTAVAGTLSPPLVTPSAPRLPLPLKPPASRTG